MNKSKNPIAIALSLIIIVCSISLSNAQTTASVSWELSLNTRTNYQTVGAVVGALQSFSDQLKFYDYGGEYLSQRSYSSGGNSGYWPNESEENSDRYCQFAAYPRNGVSFKLSNISMRLGGSGSNKFMVSIYYSTNSFESRTALIESKVIPLDDLDQFSFDVSANNISIDETQQISIRIYPWLFGGDESDKYLSIRDVIIEGSTEGTVIPDLPIVASIGIDKISTQSILFKGKAIDDGGVNFDSLGVVFSTTENANINDNMVLINAEEGPYQATLDGLKPATTYYANAFAKNAAGVTYGKEIGFTTLDKLSVPGVSTTNVNNISPKGAVANGNVHFDGGLDVTLTGFCYSTQVSPTLSNIVINEGSGLGNFNAYLSEVDAGQTYYVRAFAENNEGVGYGDQIEFVLPNFSPDIYYTVDQAGNGDYTTVQEAFNAVPSNYMGKITVYVKNGLYKEKLELTKAKINVHLLGENRDSTILSYDDYSGRVVDGVTIGTSTSYSVAIDADDFIVQDITFQNTSQAAQAVALRVKGDRVIFNHCNLLGFQDTYYTWGRGRVYHEDCYIEGTVDFIFGSSVALFENCTIKSLRNSPVTAANTEEGFEFGYVFNNCNLIPGIDITKASLGRPWRPYAQTVFMNSSLGEHIIEKGWIPWSGNNNHLTAYYAEYNNSGEGFVPESRVEWSHQLSDEEAAAYTMENIFSKETSLPNYAYDWIPEFDAIPVDPDDTTTIGIKNWNKHIKTHIYPNPSKSGFTIEYNIQKESKVHVSIYSLDGNLIQKLENKTQKAGTHTVYWNPTSIKSGVYLCKSTFNGQTKADLLIIE